MNDTIRSLPNGDFEVIRNEKPKETPVPQKTTKRPVILSSRPKSR